MSENNSSTVLDNKQDKTAKDTWNILLGYAGNRRYLIWISIIAAVLSTVTGIIPYTYIHKIIYNIL